VDIAILLLVLLAVVASFAVSASAGFGGSLILVPALALLLGSKSGVALAALLLAGNNVMKVVAYRRSMPYRRAAPIIAMMVVATAIGAALFVAAPERVVTGAVIVTFALTFLAERIDLKGLRRFGAPILALASGATSGFSGTSGPLKGLAMRTLQLDRVHLVGALSLGSLVGDATKASIFAEAGLISRNGFYFAIAAIPLMIGSTYLGRRINSRVSELGFTRLFWAVMAGYTTRLLVTM